MLSGTQPPARRAVDSLTSARGACGPPLATRVSVERYLTSDWFGDNERTLDFDPDLDPTRVFHKDAAPIVVVDRDARQPIPRVHPRLVRRLTEADRRFDDEGSTTRRPR